MKDFEMTKELLSLSLVSFITEKFISVKRLTEMFDIDEKQAASIILTLKEKGIINDYDFSSNGMPFITKEEFDSLFVSDTVKNTEKLGVDCLENLRKCFCFFDGSVNIFTLEKEEEKPLPEELKSSLKKLLAGGGYITLADIQKSLKIPYSTACRTMDYLEKESLVKKCTLYKIL